ncbi:MAG: hypothetical protein JSU96_16885 [Acidobacteriota bacterium]|nr:MAG: hypothetical protein JSU96_16885 [Acidobacteriota bacterium]
MSKQPRDDPLYLNAWREAKLILSIWFTCLIYTVGVCYLYGYLSHEPDPAATGPSVGVLAGPLDAFNRAPESLQVPFGIGMPDWVFYGVGLPWLICIIVTWWFCLFYFVEDDLGPDLRKEETR